MMRPMSADSLIAVRSDFSIEEPWRTPPAAETVRLRLSADGGAPYLSTTVAVYFDDDYLSLVFSGSDDHVVATYSGHDDPLYDEDVVEVFLAPERREEYFEIEVSPLGAMFDAHIISPDGNRQTMRADKSWNAGAIAAVRRLVELDGTATCDTLVRIPFASVGRPTPRPGERWLANFFRIDRHPVRGDEYSAWRPTLRVPPDFHVPDAFGSIEFRS
jgi:hypothetical protein